MKYLGSNVDQDERCILFSQEDYIKDLKPIEIELTKDKNQCQKNNTIIEPFVDN